MITAPAGAHVFLDGRDLGSSPVTVPFTFYGTRALTVRHAGYRTQSHLEVMSPPYFQEFPYDVYYETLTKDRYRDERTWRYVLTPQTAADVSRAQADLAVLRAHELRER